MSRRTQENGSGHPAHRGKRWRGGEGRKRDGNILHKKRECCRRKPNIVSPHAHSLLTLNLKAFLNLSVTQRQGGDSDDTQCPHASGSLCLLTKKIIKAGKDPTGKTSVPAQRRTPKARGRESPAPLPGHRNLHASGSEGKHTKRRTENREWEALVSTCRLAGAH